MPCCGGVVKEGGGEGGRGASVAAAGRDRGCPAARSSSPSGHAADSQAGTAGRILAELTWAWLRARSAASCTMLSKPPGSSTPRLGTPAASGLPASEHGVHGVFGVEGQTPIITECSRGKNAAHSPSTPGSTHMSCPTGAALTLDLGTDFLHEDVLGRLAPAGHLLWLERLQDFCLQAGERARGHRVVGIESESAGMHARAKQVRTRRQRPEDSAGSLVVHGAEGQQVPAPPTHVDGGRVARSPLGPLLVHLLGLGRALRGVVVERGGGGALAAVQAGGGAGACGRSVHDARMLKRCLSGGALAAVQAGGGAGACGRSMHDIRRQMQLRRFLWWSC